MVTSQSAVPSAGVAADAGTTLAMSQDMRAAILPSMPSPPATPTSPSSTSPPTSKLQAVKQKLASIVDFFVRAFTTADSAGFLQLGAAISFHVLLAIGPLFVVVLAAAGFFFGDDAVHGRLFSELAGITGASGASFIEGVVRRAAGKGQGVAAVIGFFMFVWTASGVFDQMSQALANINRVANGHRPIVVPPKQDPWYKKLADTGFTFVKGRLSAVAMLVVIVFLLAASLIASSVISVMTAVFDPWLDTRGLVMVANLVVSFLLFSTLSAALFRLLSRPRVVRMSAMRGGAAAAVLFLVGRSVLGLVIPLTASESAFGPAASVISILYWAWFSAVTLLLGFAVAVTDAKDRGRDGVEPPSPLSAALTNDKGLEHLARSAA